MEDASSIIRLCALKTTTVGWDVRIRILDGRTVAGEDGNICFCNDMDVYLVVEALECLVFFFF